MAGHIEVVEILIDAGAKVDLKDMVRLYYRRYNIATFATLRRLNKSLLPCDI